MSTAHTIGIYDERDQDDTRIIDITVADLRQIIRDEVARLHDETPEWMSYEQAAEYTGMQIQTIRNWAAQGKVEKRGHRKGARLNRRSIEQYLGRRGGFMESEG